MSLLSNSESQGTMGTVTKVLSQSLIPNKRCSRSSFYGNKPKFHKKAIRKSDGQVCFSDGATTTLLIL
ncbi:TPA: hypothetical protein ACGU3U_000950, partial [Enterococcus faecium]